MQLFENVLDGGQPAHMDRYSPAMDMWDNSAASHRVKIVALGFDITDRKKAEEALMESEERFRALAQTTPVGVGVSSADGVIIYTNPAYESILGYGHGELIGKKFTSVYIDPADRASWLQAIREGRDVRDYKMMLKKNDGTPVWVAVNTSNICYEGKQTIIGTIQDISYRKRTEEALKKREANLKRSNTELQQFA
jgi:PAS domain S-box-containing protein